MKLSSEINGEPVSLVIIDHPSNVGYPTYWHARDYGLFAANTLGQKIFSEGKNELNFSLKKGESVTFKYRLVVAAEDLSDEVKLITWLTNMPNKIQDISWIHNQSRRRFLQKSLVAGAGLSLIDPLIGAGHDEKIRNETWPGHLPVGQRLGFANPDRKL